MILIVSQGGMFCFVLFCFVVSRKKCLFCVFFACGFDFFQEVLFEFFFFFQFFCFFCKGSCFVLHFFFCKCSSFVFPQAFCSHFFVKCCFFARDFSLSSAIFFGRGLYTFAIGVFFFFARLFFSPQGCYICLLQSVAFFPMDFVFFFKSFVFARGFVFFLQ